MLIKTTAELKRNYSALNINANIMSFASFIDDATEEYVLPILGRALYDEIEAVYAALNPTQTQQRLIARVQGVITLYALYKSTIPNSMSLGDLGIHDQNTEHSTPIPQWKVRSLQHTLITDADKRAERLLEFLETNVSDYPLWVSSAYYISYRDLFVANVAAFERHINIGGSRRTFIVLRPYVVDAERDTLMPLIGAAFYTALKSKIATGTPFTPAEKVLLPYIEKIIAFTALSNALPFLQFYVEGNGLYLISSNDGITTKQAQANAAHLHDMCSQKIAAAKKSLLGIIDNHTNYPLYQTPATPGIALPSNDGMRGGAYF